MNIKLYLLLILPLLLISCSDRYEQNAYERIESYINATNVKKQLDGFASENDSIKKKNNRAVFEKRPLNEIRPYYNFIEDEKAVAELAEFYFKHSINSTVYKDRLSRYKPYYFKKYKNIWILYGCTNLGKAVKRDWKYSKGLDEKLIFIDGNNGKLLLIW